MRSVKVVAGLMLLAVLGACVRHSAHRPTGPEEHALDGAGHAFYVTTEARPEARQPFLLLVPPRARAVAVLLPGGQGEIGLRPDGKIARGGNFLVRSRERFTERGLAVAVIAPPEDHPSLYEFRTSPEHTQDLGGVIAYLRARLGLPVWLVGTSRGTISAAYAAGRLAPPAGPDGLVLASSITVRSQGESVLDADLAAIRVPTLLVQHRLDACPVTPLSGAQDLLQRLVHAPARELVVITGGGPPSGPPCQALHYHGYVGSAEQAVQAIAGWIEAHPPPAP
jgi:fermentation-respiration switch protein FrsA (DUF1100 family)